MATSRNKIVTAYARMWPREVFATFKGKKKAMAKTLPFLNGPGVYILYRDDRPYYIGQAQQLRHRLWGHATQTETRYYHFWNFFSAFTVSDRGHRDELERILIAAMPTANSARPSLRREPMTRPVRNLLREVYQYRLSRPTTT